MDLKIIVVFSALMLGSCAGSMQNADEKQDLEISVAKPAEKQPEVQTDIDPDVLYYLMTAELAGQRGQYDVALEGYLRAAREVDDPRIAERAAKIALYLKDPEKTEEAVSLWLQHEPDSLVARKIAAMSAIQNEDKALAIEQLNYLLQADPSGFEGTLMDLAQAAEAEGKGDFVYDVVDDLILQHPQQAELYFVQAVLAAKGKDNDIAEAKVQKALDLRPGWIEAIFFQSRLAVRAGDFQRAEELLRKAAELEPENIQIKKQLAQVLIKNHEYSAAAEVYEEVLEQQPDDAGSKYALALVYLQLKQTDRARSVLLQLVDVPGWQDQSRLYLGRIEAGEKNIDAALLWFDRVEKGPLAFEAGMNAVSTLIIGKRFVEADKRLAVLKNRFPEKQLQLTLLQAELFSAEKQYQQAFDLLTEVLQQKPGQRELLYTRAMVADKLNKLDVVEADLKLLLKQYPDDVNALNALGYVLVDKTDRYQEAEGYLRQAIEKEPDEPVIIDSYGWLLFKQGKNQQAIEYLQKAYELKPDEGEIAAHLVEVLWVSGKKREARELTKKALGAVADKESLNQLLKRIPGLK